MVDPREPLERQHVLEALDLPERAVIVPLAGGASGSAWRIDADGRSYTLRRSAPSLTAGRLAAMDAAGHAGLPAPQLIRRARTADGDLLLLSWLPGVTIYDEMIRNPSSIPRLGRRMGLLQRRLHGVAAPSDVPAAASDSLHPFDAGMAVQGLPHGHALIHLDWHPMNLLCDADGDEITGIIDWDNARHGHPMLDLARTHTLLTVEPSLGTLSHAGRAALDQFIETWADGYGSEARAIPNACLRWAGLVMLADLAPRYAADPARLQPLRRWTDSWI